jgi:hypothetical protein
MQPINRSPQWSIDQWVVAVAAGVHHKVLLWLSIP